jgi:hypothetical protein
MPARRRADEFAAVVDGARPLDDATSDQAREFAAIVARLREVEGPSMRPEFAAQLRGSLMAEAATALADLPRPAAAERSDRSDRAGARDADRRWSVRGLQVTTTTLLVCATAGGVAAASQSALPGDPLYQVKRGLEWVQVTTAGSDQDRGDVLLDQASERLDEAEQLAISRPDDPRTASLIAGALDTFQQQATDGSSALVDDYRADGDPASIVEVRDFADTSSTQLDDLSRIVPPDAQRDVVDAAGILTGIDDHARDTCATCSPLAPLQLPSHLRTVADTAKDVLDVVPGVLGSATGDGGGQPPIELPTLPILSGSPDPGDTGADGSQGSGDGQSSDQGGGGRNATHHHSGSSQNGGQNGGHSGGQQPQLPLPTGGGSTSSPSLPLPSVPGVPLPTVPLPSLPLPSVPLPTLLPLP